jgi:hypothetical protein
MSALPPKKVETELNSVVKEPSTNKDLSKIQLYVIQGKKKYSYFIYSFTFFTKYEITLT